VQTIGEIDLAPAHRFAPLREIVLHA
jgi:hypothetical protein